MTPDQWQVASTRARWTRQRASKLLVVGALLSGGTLCGTVFLAVGASFTASGLPEPPVWLQLALISTVVLVFFVGVALLVAGVVGCALLPCARRDREGACSTCGYDLRGLPEPRCPECGTECSRTDLEAAGLH